MDLFPQTRRVGDERHSVNTGQDKCEVFTEHVMLESRDDEEKKSQRDVSVQ